jgi:CRISPR/Cas system-associated exonuclease Cas4 (RecB family)
MPYNGKYKRGSVDAYKISRSKIDNYVSCPRCFYLDRVLGISQPPGFPFNLNSAVDHLLKKEFDLHRAAGTVHPLTKAYGLDLTPFDHHMMDKWRENFHGVQHLDKENNLLVFGAVDDIWTDEKGTLYVVDYKATSKDSEVNLDAEWQNGYKRQMEVYQWLLRQNGFDVSDTGYFVYCNGKRDRKAFDGVLEFDIKIIPYRGSDTWIPATLRKVKSQLESENIPDFTPSCEYCNYQQKIREV